MQAASTLATWQHRTVSGESDPFANSNEQNAWSSSGGAVGIERKNKYTTINRCHQWRRISNTNTVVQQHSKVTELHVFALFC